MNNQENSTVDNQNINRENISIEDSQELLNITQRLVKEFIDTKKRISTDDRKLNAIGKALITQNSMLETILQSQSNRGVQLVDSLGDISNRQEDLVKGVFDIKDSIIGLDDVQVEQEKFVQNLNRFQERHEALVDKSTEQSGESIQRLERISEQITNLFNQVGEVDIENRVVEIAERTSEIKELIDTHAQKQEDAREDASKQMLDLLSEVTLFRQELSEEGLTGKLNKVQSVSEENNKMIEDLNDKFDIFIEIYEISKVDTIDDLEDLFTTSTDNTKDEVSDVNMAILFDESNDKEIEEHISFEDVDNTQLDEDLSNEVQFEDTYETSNELDMKGTHEEVEDNLYDEDESYCGEENNCDEVIGPDPEFSVQSLVDDESDEVDLETYVDDIDKDVSVEDEGTYDDDIDNDVYVEDEEIYKENLDDDVYIEDEETYEENVDEDVYEEDFEDEQSKVEFGNDMEIDEFKRIDREKDSLDTTDKSDNKGFFSKLFGGR